MIRFSKIIPSFFVDKASCTRQFESELSLHSLALLFPIKKGIFLPLLQGELHILTKPSLLRKEGCNRPTRCSEPLRSKVGGPSKVYAILCGMGPPCAMHSIPNLKPYLHESAKRKDYLYIIVSSSLTLMRIQRTFNAFSICSFILTEAKLSILGELSIISCSIRSRKEVDSREVKVLL